MSTELYIQHLAVYFFVFAFCRIIQAIQSTSIDLEKKLKEERNVITEELLELTDAKKKIVDLEAKGKDEGI